MPEIAIGAGNLSSGISPINLAMHYQEVNERKRLQAEQDKKDKQAHQDAMQKYFGNFYDATKYHTGLLEFDKQTNDDVNKGLTDLTKFIQDHPDASMNDLTMLSQQSLAPIVQHYTVGKTLQESLKAGSSAYDKDTGIDTRALYTTAAHNALYKPDPNKPGQFVKKTAEEIDTGHDYIRDVLDKQKDAYSKGRYDLSKGLGELGKNNVTKAVDVHYTGKNGHDIKHSYNITFNPLVQELDTDKNGHVITDSSGAPKLRLKSDPLKDKSGNVIQNRVTEDVYNTLANTEGEVAQIARASREYAKKIRPGVPVPDYGTPEAKDLAREYLYTLIPDEAKVEREKNENTTPTFLTKINLGAADSKGSKTDAQVQYDNAYETIDVIATQQKVKGKSYTQVNLLPLDAQKLVIEAAQNVTGGIAKKAKYGNKVTMVPVTQADVKIIKADNGDLNIYNAHTDGLIGKLSKTGVNLAAKQPGVIEKRAALKDGERESKAVTPSGKIKGSHKKLY